MPASRDITEEDQKARAFIGGIGAGPMRLGDIPLELPFGDSAALWLMEEGVRAIQKAEKNVTCVKAGKQLATDMMTARWRKGEGCVIAETGFFAHTFTALPGGNGWSLTACDMLPTVRVDLLEYMRIFGDLKKHVKDRRALPDFYLRDLTPEEVKKRKLREGAVLSVAATTMKRMGRRMLKEGRHQKDMRAQLDEWRSRVVLLDKWGTDLGKNARIIS